MDRHVVILGGGTAGTLAANRLHRCCADRHIAVTVVDKEDRRDAQTALLAAPGLYGPHTTQPPEHLHLRAGVSFRHVWATTVDLDRSEVCLADGTTLRYDVLVVATGAGAGCVTRSPGLADNRGTVPADPLTRRSLNHPAVYAIGAVCGGGRPSGPALQVQAERLALGVTNHLAAAPAGTS